MNDWKATTLGQVLTLQRGYDLPTRLRHPGSHPIVSSSGPSGTHAEAKVAAPGIVTGRYGTLGQVFWIDQPFWPLNTALYVRDFRGNDPRFLYYLLRSLDLAHCNDKSGVPGVNRNDLHELEVLRPSVDEQRAIAHVLGSLDDKIAANRALNATLEATCRALFRSWFVDFDPVVAKSEGRKPPHLAAEVAALFPSRLQDTEQGPVPEGWAFSEIGKAVRVVGGSTPSTSTPAFWSGNIAWITPKDLSGAKSPVVLDSNRKITAAGLKTISSGLLPPQHTVLLSSRAPIGYLAIPHVPLAVNQGFIAMICDKRLPQHFVYFWTEANMVEVLARAGGTTFAEISKTSFRPIPVLLPTTALLQRFENLASAAFQQIAANEREVQTLTTLRDALLPRLLSGELRVRQAEELVEEVV